MSWIGSQTIDEYSLAAIPLTMLFNEQVLSTGTGFVWQHNDVFAIFTNWHNVSGVDLFTGKNLSPTGGRPNKIAVMMNDANAFGRKIGLTLDIVKADGTPGWLVHPVHKREIDIVALVVSLPTNIAPHPINRMPQEERLSISVGGDAFILGFPFDPAPSYLPVWKHGSIATEPALVPQGGKYILLDTATRPGMSGSPVILRSFGTHLYSDNSREIDGQTKTRMIGIYSGRITAAERQDVQLGIVWPVDFIEELARGGVLDEPL